jgi:hypothetical protein
VLVTASRAVPAEVFGGPDDREPRLIDRLQLARPPVEVESNLVDHAPDGSTTALGTDLIFAGRIVNSSVNMISHHSGHYREPKFGTAEAVLRHSAWGS